MAKSYNKCNVAELKEFFGRQPTSAEMKHISRVIEREAGRLRVEDPALTREQSYQKAAPIALEIAQREVGEAKRRKALHTTVVNQASRLLKTVWPDMPDQGLRSLLIGTQWARTGSRRSAGAMGETYASRNLASLHKVLEALDPDESRGVMRRFASGALDDDIRRIVDALAQEGKDIDSLTRNKDWDLPERYYSDKAMANDIAIEVYRVSEEVRKRVNAVGGNIQRKRGRISRQSHDVSRLKDARKYVEKHTGKRFPPEATNEDIWVNYMLDNLDLERSFMELDLSADNSIDFVTKGLRQAYREITGLVEKSVDEDLNEGLGVASFAHEQERIFEFYQGVDGEIQYNKIFSGEKIFESLHKELNTLGKKEGLMEVFGPDPHRGLQDIVETAYELADTPEKQIALKKYLGESEVLVNSADTSTPAGRQWSEVTGQNARPIDNLWATIGQSSRFLMNTLFLGRATLASMADVATTASTFRFQGRTIFDSAHASVKSIFDSKLDSESKKSLVNSLLPGIEYYVANNSRGWSDDNLVGNISKLSNLYFRANLLSWWTNNAKKGVAIAQAKYLGEQSQLDWSQLSPEMRRMLPKYGIYNTDWAILQQVDWSKAPTGEKYLSPDALRTIPKDVLPESARKILDSRLRLYYSDMIDSSVVTPDAETRARTTGGANQGTLQGEINRYFFQYKQFPLAIYNRVLRRELYGRGTDERNPLSALASGNGEMQGAMELMMSSTLMGYTAISLKAIAEGKTPPTPTDSNGMKDLIMDSMLQGGALTLFGDIVVGEINRKYPTDAIGILESVAGPVPNFVMKKAKQAGGITYGALTGDMAEPLGQAINHAIQKEIPLANIFYLQWALKYGILNRISEQLAPGYKEKLKQRAEQNGQKQFLPQ